MTHLYDSINNIANIVSTIHRTKGQDWAKHVVGGDGRQVFSEKEQETVSTLFNPFVSDIVTFFGHGFQEGGEQRPHIAAALSELKSIKAKAGEPEVEEAPPVEDVTTMFGLDELYIKFLQKIDGVNELVKGFASTSGIMKFEKESDEQEDWRIVPDMITSKMKTVPNPMIYNTAVFLETLRLPLRTIIMIIYLFLDVARISAGVSGKIERRNILSMVVALIDLLRGDWKKAIFSYMGVFGEKPLIRGEFLKIFLTGFQMLSPEIQETFTYGAFDATKSFLVGLLLMIFRATAVDSVRLPLVTTLHKIRLAKKALDEPLETQTPPLLPRPDYLSPSWEDLNNLQALMADRDFVCSTEYDELLKTVRIPISKEGEIIDPCANPTPSVTPGAPGATPGATPNATPVPSAPPTPSAPSAPPTPSAPSAPPTPSAPSAPSVPESDLVPTTYKCDKPETPPINDNIVRLVLEILRIPVSDEFRKYKCGEAVSKPFAEIVVERSQGDAQRTVIATNPREKFPVSANTEKSTKYTETTPMAEPGDPELKTGGAKKTPRSKRTPRRSVKH